MSSEKILIQVPHDKGHAHFYDTIESFPGLQAGPSFEDREKYLRDTIRYQLLSTTPQQASRRTPLPTQSSPSASASASPNAPTSSSASRPNFPEPPSPRPPRNSDSASDQHNSI